MLRPLVQTARAQDTTYELQPRTKKPTLPTAEANGMDSEHHAGYRRTGEETQVQKKIYQKPKERKNISDFASSNSPRKYTRTTTKDDDEREHRKDMVEPSRLHHFEPTYCNNSS